MATEGTTRLIHTPSTGPMPIRKGVLRPQQIVHIHVHVNVHVCVHVHVHEHVHVYGNKPCVSHGVIDPPSPRKKQVSVQAHVHMRLLCRWRFWDLVSLRYPMDELGVRSLNFPQIQLATYYFRCWLPWVGWAGKIKA